MLIDNNCNARVVFHIYSLVLALGMAVEQDSVLHLSCWYLNTEWLQRFNSFACYHLFLVALGMLLML